MENDNAKIYNKLKEYASDFNSLTHYIHKHDVAKTDVYKLEYEERIQAILDKHSVDEQYPAYGSKWVCKKDAYRYNLDFYIGDKVTVEEIRISKKVYVVVVVKGYQKIVDYKDFKQLFKKEN